jgi:hypothetical protein
VATARDVCEQALKEIGVLAAGETAAAEDAADAFKALNRLVDQMAADRPFIYTETRTEWSIVSGTGTYTVGTGGTVNIARPVHILKINYQETSSDPDAEYPLDKFTDLGWAELQAKDQTSSLPSHYYYNPTYPLGTLILWPAPTSATLQGVIYAWTAITQFAGLTTAVSLPPGYEEFLITTLAVRLANSYGRVVEETLQRRQKEAEAIVKRSNKRLEEMRFDPGALIGNCQTGAYDIRHG